MGFLEQKLSLLWHSSGGDICSFGFMPGIWDNFRIFGRCKPSLGGGQFWFSSYSNANSDMIAILCLALQSNFSIQSDFSLQTIPDTKILSFPASYFKLGAQNILKRSWKSCSRIVSEAVICRKCCSQILKPLQIIVCKVCKVQRKSAVDILQFQQRHKNNASHLTTTSNFGRGPYGHIDFVFFSHKNDSKWKQ